jgi:hypothetical protein
MRAQLSELRGHSGFTSLATSRFISNVGNGISPVALAFGVLALPGATGTDLSIVMAARMFPMIALMLFGGVIGDRCKRMCQKSLIHELLPTMLWALTDYPLLELLRPDHWRMHLGLAP